METSSGLAYNGDMQTNVLGYAAAGQGRALAIPPRPDRNIVGTVR